LKRAHPAAAIVSTAMAFVGVTLVLATPTALSMISLSGKYAAATTESARGQFQAAGEAILATDIWHGTGAMLGGFLLQCGALLASVVMLRSDVFGKTIAYVGIMTHGLDLAHIVLGPVRAGRWSRPHANRWSPLSDMVPSGRPQAASTGTRRESPAGSHG
jgi:hypothetical protein